MELEKLYNIAEKENIDIISFKMKNKAIACCSGNSYAIGINYSKINNSTEEKEILSEELGHYYYDAYYDISSDKVLIDKQEYRAKKWSYNTLIPFEKLKSAISKRN